MNHRSIHTAIPIGKERVLYILCGPESKIIVANVTTDATDKEIPLSVGNPKSTHGQLRHARLTDQGTLLVAHMDNGKVSEYDGAGTEVWSVKFSGPWAASRLAGGNMLVNNWLNQWSDKLDIANAPVQALEITPEKKVV